MAQSAGTTERLDLDFRCVPVFNHANLKTALRKGGFIEYSTAINRLFAGNMRSPRSIELIGDKRLIALPARLSCPHAGPRAVAAPGWVFVCSVATRPAGL